VFGTRTGRPLGQRNVLRALYRAQERARDVDGLPTFPELFEVDERGHLVVDEEGSYVPRNVKRRERRLPDFHALRHGAAMDCDDAEEARDLLRQKNSNVTRAIYRAHFGDRRREALRARMETRMETAGDVEAPRNRTMACSSAASAALGDKRQCVRGLQTREVAGSKSAAPIGRGSQRPNDPLAPGIFHFTFRAGT
jgi:hypothetical protein